MAQRNSMEADFFFTAAGLTRDEVLDSFQMQREAIDPASARNTVPLVILEAVNFLDDPSHVPPGAQLGYLRVPVWLAQNYNHAKVVHLAKEHTSYFPEGTAYIVVDTLPVVPESMAKQIRVVANHPKIGFDVGFLYKSEANRAFFVGSKTTLVEIDISSPWRILGRIIWWIGTPQE